MIDFCTVFLLEALPFDFWVIDTDYANYAFAYGCGIKAEDGSCERPHAWKFGRRPQLETDYMDLMDGPRRRVCLEPLPIQTLQNIDMAHGMDNPSLYGVLQEINNCSICLEEFTHPKFLPCGHTFCLDCLEKIYSQKQSGHITCSICRNKHKVPQRGVAGFPNDHRVQQIKDVIIKKQPKHSMHKDCVVCPKKALNICLHCDEPMCKKCSSQHQGSKHFSNHRVVKMTDCVECGHHKGKLATRYCMPCSSLVCKLCIISKHADHDISLVKMQNSPYELPSDDPRVTVKKLEAEFQKNEAQYTANIQAIETSSRDINSAVEAHTQRLMDTIQRNKQQIINKSADIHKAFKDNQHQRKVSLKKGADQIKKIGIDMEKKFGIDPAAGTITEKILLDSFKHDLEVITPETIPAIVMKYKFIPRNSLDVGEIQVSGPDTATREVVTISSVNEHLLMVMVLLLMLLQFSSLMDDNNMKIMWFLLFLALLPNRMDNQPLPQSLLWGLLLCLTMWILRGHFMAL